MTSAPMGRIATLRARAELARAGRERRLIVILVLATAVLALWNGLSEPVVIYPSDCYGLD